MMKTVHISRAASLVFLASMAAACATTQTTTVHFGDREEVIVAGVDGCDDYGSAVVRIDPGQPLILLVHGCKASSGRLRTLAEVFEAHGQQTLCFNYDYRSRLKRSSQDLLDVLSIFGSRLDDPQITVLGHSQGGLVARRAIIRERSGDVQLDPEASIRVVTVSSPFNGIQSSAHCGFKALHVLTLGITTAICQGIAGSIWSEVHPRSDFVVEPGHMIDLVETHLLLATDELDTCRREAPDGSCAEDDFVFSLEEQFNPRFSEDSRVTELEVASGHAAIIGDENRPPVALIEILQEHGVMRNTPVDRLQEIQALLARLY